MWPVPSRMHNELELVLDKNMHRIWDWMALVNRIQTGNLRGWQVLAIVTQLSGLSRRVFYVAIIIANKHGPLFFTGFQLLLPAMLLL